VDSSPSPPGVTTKSGTRMNGRAAKIRLGVPGLCEASRTHRTNTRSQQAPADARMHTNRT